MTWIVSTPTHFGYTVAVSDTRVTTPSGHFDCLQKIHAVHPDIIMGFAGNVHLGFLLKDDLQDFLGPPEPGFGWLPNHITGHWPERAKRVWSNYKTNHPLLSEDELAVHIQLFMTHPTEDNGIPGVARTYVLTFRSPEFHPEVTPPGEWASIGSGTKAYTEQLEKLHQMRGWHPLANFEIQNPGGFGRSIATTVYFDITQDPEPSVGAILQTCLVWPARFELLNHKIEHTGGGWSIAKLDLFPDITLCTSWNELVDHLSSRVDIADIETAKA